MATVAEVPAGATFVDTFKKSFVDVPVDAANNNAVDTTSFLEAAESLTTMFDVLGSVAFSPVKGDMLGNVKVWFFFFSLCFLSPSLSSSPANFLWRRKIRDRQLAAPAESATLQSLVVNELKTKKHTATEGLLWLVRGLEFTYLGLSQNIEKESEELSDSFRNAYGSTLKPYHSFLIKPIFSAAMSACPYRADFYAKLASDQVQLIAKLKEWLAALGRIVNILKAFLSTKEAKW